MAESLTTFSDPRTEMSILETNQYLLSQLAKTKQSFRDLTEKFLTSKATAYSLANQLQKYKSEEHKALIESVLEEGALFEGELAEKRSPAARLGYLSYLTCKIKIPTVSTSEGYEDETHDY
uniref:neuroblastoma breakpoint family member 6-like protein n=1 Tax=Panthera onca TaxID=9690 RepID=UPI0029544849